MRLDQAGHVGTVDVFQSDVELTIDRPGFEDPDDVLVFQFSSGECFGPKTSQQRLVVGLVAGKDLQRHLAIFFGVVRQVDHAHPASAEQPEDAKTTE